MGGPEIARAQAPNLPVGEFSLSPSRTLHLEYVQHLNVLSLRFCVFCAMALRINDLQ